MLTWATKKVSALGLADSQILTKVMGESLWRNANFSTNLKWHFCGLKKPCFLFETSSNYLSRSLEKKNTFEENANFWPKPRVNHLKKNANFLTNLKWHFFGLKKPCFLFETSSNYLSRRFEKKNNFWRKCKFLTKTMG